MLEKNVDEIVKENHAGTQCWIDFKNVCRKAYCTQCQVYLDAVSIAFSKVIGNNQARVPEVLTIRF